jgi:hypothetical protein
VATPQAPPRRVFVVEVDRGDGLHVLTGRLQRDLEAAGEAEPQVEVYPTGERLPLYQQLARSQGELLWTPTTAPFSLAPVFAETDGEPQDGPLVDRPRFDDFDEAEKTAAYLWAGELLLSSPERLDDALAPALGAVVPADIRTDGTWIWTDATTYYLEEYGLEPPAGLLAHIRDAYFSAPEVDGATRHRALDFLTRQDESPQDEADAVPLTPPGPDSL